MALRYIIGWHHGHAVPGFLNSFDHDAQARVESLFDDPQLATPFSDARRLEADSVIGVKNHDLMTPPAVRTLRVEARARPCY